MKTIGLLGGMSWQSSQGYYCGINQGINRALGGLHSAKLVLYSVDFELINRLQHQGDWEACGNILREAALRLQAAGAEGLVICTNTMHKLAPILEAALEIPLLHIADATAESLVASQITTVGLLGTAFTMEQDFYKGRLQDRYGMDVLVPSAEERAWVHRIIYDELCQGNIKPESRQQYLDIIARLADRGAQGVILGCTEIGLLVDQSDTPIALLDTTKIHIQKAIAWALDEL